MQAVGDHSRMRLGALFSLRWIQAAFSVPAKRGESPRSPGQPSPSWR